MGAGSRLFHSNHGPAILVLASSSRSYSLLLVRARDLLWSRQPITSDMWRFAREINVKSGTKCAMQGKISVRRISSTRYVDGKLRRNYATARTLIELNRKNGRMKEACAVSIVCGLARTGSPPLYAIVEWAWEIELRVTSGLREISGLNPRATPVTKRVFSTETHS